MPWHQAHHLIIGCPQDATLRTPKTRNVLNKSWNFIFLRLSFPLLRPTMLRFSSSYDSASLSQCKSVAWKFARPENFGSFGINCWIPSASKTEWTDQCGVCNFLAQKLKVYIAMPVFFRCGVLSHYFQFPATTSVTDFLITSQESLEFHQYHIPQDATFCNVNPFNSEYRSILQEKNIPSLEDYMERVESLKKSNSSGSIFQSYQSQINSLMGYYHFIGPQNAMSLSHTADDFIVDCNIIGFGDTGFGLIPCDRKRQIRRYMTPEQFSCYTVGFNDIGKNSSFVMMGVEVILYTENDLTPDSYYWPTNSASGARVGKFLGGCFLSIEGIFPDERTDGARRCDNRTCNCSFGVKIDF